MLSLRLSHGINAVRLTLCLIGTLLIHLLFFSFTPRESPLLPSLQFSLTPPPLSVQLKTIPKPSSRILSTPREEVKKKKEEAIDHQAAKKETQTEDQQETQETSPRVEEYVSNSTSPREVSEAEYLSNPPPTYPEQARRRRQQGTVLLLVHIDAVGQVEKVTVKESSGFATLDRCALATVSKWRFAPAISEGRAMPSQVLVPIRFELGTL